MRYKSAKETKILTKLQARTQDTKRIFSMLPGWVNDLDFSWFKVIKESTQEKPDFWKYMCVVWQANTRNAKHVRTTDPISTMNSCLETIEIFMNRAIAHRWYPRPFDFMPSALAAQLCEYDASQFVIWDIISGEPDIFYCKWILAHKPCAGIPLSLCIYIYIYIYEELRFKLFPLWLMVHG